MERKTFSGHFKQQTGKIRQKNTWTWQKKENLKGEKDTLVMVAQNNNK